MFVVRYRKIWFTLSALLIALSAFAVFTYGFKTSIDLKNLVYTLGAPYSSLGFRRFHLRF